MVVLINTVFFVRGEMGSLRPFASDATCELNVFRHDCHTLCVDGGQIGVFEKANEVGLSRFLEGEDS